MNFAVSYDGDSDCLYVRFKASVQDGEAVQQIVHEIAGKGEIVLDLDADHRLIGLEIIGAEALAPPEVVAAGKGRSA